ncbi:MAG: mechanosensitive ion channel, partial [Acidimicrobiia bacterium]|nr:mechanosensitive ion channel [Acidimicrobiia bacterium]
GGYGTYLGLLSAGIAIALADVLKNMAGFLFILVRRPFRLGDRVEIGGQIGDVVDIRVFRFSMLEVGNWVHADQSTGRIVHVPNGLVFTQPLANYTEGFEFIWHEIPVLVTFESDWRKAQDIVQSALEEHAPHHDPVRAQRELREAAGEYRIMYTHLTPRVYLTVKDSGVLLTGRVLVEVRKRRAVEDVMWRSILDGIAAEPTVELAYPTVRTFLHDPIRVESDR